MPFVSGSATRQEGTTVLSLAPNIARHCKQVLQSHLPVLLPTCKQRIHRTTCGHHHGDWGSPVHGSRKQFIAKNQSKPQASDRSAQDTRDRGCDHHSGYPHGEISNKKTKRIATKKYESRLQSVIPRKLNANVRLVAPKTGARLTGLHHLSVHIRQSVRNSPGISV